MEGGLTHATGELALYYDYARLIQARAIPYKDFFPEYPPLALFWFHISQVFGDKWFTLSWYTIITICIFIAAIIIHKSRGNLFIFLSAILPLGGLLWDRFDMIPALFALLSIFSLTNKKHVLSYIFLTVGFLTKIFPLLLLPYIIVKTPLAENLKGAIVSISIISLVVGIILSMGGKIGLLKFVEFQGKRGVQIESIRATPYLLSKDTKVIENHYTYEVTK